MWNRKHYLPTRKHHGYLDGLLFRSSSAPNLFKDQPPSKQQHQQQLESSSLQTKQAWSTQEGKAKVKTVVPFRRPSGRKAPNGVPRLDFSILGLNRDEFEPIILLEDEQKLTQDIPVTVEVEKETTTAESGKDGHVVPASSPLKNTPNHQRDNKKVAFMGSPNARTIQKEPIEPVKKLKFSCFMVTRCGRDIHREITGYFFPQDDTLAVYELKHLAKRPSAFAMFDRRQYYHLRGRRRGELYTLADIYEGADLTLETIGQKSLPESLQQQPHVTFRVTEVDLQAKKDFMFEGKSLAERIVLERALMSQQEDHHKENSSIKAVQAAVTHQLQGRATRTLVGLGRYLRQEEEKSHTGKISLRTVQQALRSYHVGITPEDLNVLWSAMDPDSTGLTSEQLATKTLIGGMSNKRKTTIIGIYRKLDPSKSGYIRLSEMKRYFLAGFHPDVISGNKSEEEVILEVTNLFAVRKSVGWHLSTPSQLIPWADFEDYFEGQNIDHPDHDQFSLCVKVWGDSM